jgi:hypothetical protein
MRLLKIGADEATRLGHHWMGPEHTLLGILRGDVDDLARRALERAGVEAEMVEGWIGRKSTKEVDDRQGVTPNPYWYSVHGRAEGISIGLGADDTNSVHFLLALLWDRRRSDLTETPGVNREAIIDALSDLGAALPPGPLPELDRKLNFTQYVEFPRAIASSVVEALAKRHPPGTGPTFGFNYIDDDVAWVRAEDGIDLQSIVDEALRQSEEPPS